MSTVHYCKPCESNGSIQTASQWCSECEEALCDECYNFHRKAKTLRNHHVVNIREIGNVPKIEVPKCPKHKTMDRDFFCVTHDTLCCRQCMAEEHRRCEKVMAVETASHEIKSSALVQNTIRDLDKIVEAFQSLSSKANESAAGSEKQRSTILKEIENKRHHICKQVDEAADKTILQLDVHYSEVQQKNKRQEKTFSSLSERFRNDKKSLQNVVKHGSACQVFILTQSLKESVREGTEKVNESSLSVDEISFDENKSVSFLFGEISRTTKTLSANIGSSEQQVTFEDDIFGKRSLYHKSSLLFPGTFLDVKGIAVSKDGRIFLCDQATLNSRIICFSSSTNYIGSCNLDSKPFNICVNEDKKEAVCTLPDSNELGVIDTDKLVLKKTVRLKITTPWGIGMTSSNIITAGYNNMIEILSKEYKSVRNVQLDLSDDISVCFIRGVTDERLYLSAKHFYAVTLNGKSVLHLDAKEDERSNGICIDPAGNIYVAFSDSKISRLSRDGQVLNDNILDSNYGELWGIAFNGDYTQMFIVTNDGNKVDVFDFK